MKKQKLKDVSKRFTRIFRCSMAVAVIFDFAPSPNQEPPAPESDPPVTVSEESKPGHLSL